MITALTYVCFYDVEDVPEGNVNFIQAKALLDRGADPLIEDNDGDISIEYCELNNRIKTAQIMKGRLKKK